MLLFLDSGIDVTAVDIANGDSLLHAAIRFSTPEKSYAKVIKALILKGAHVNAQNMVSPRFYFIRFYSHFSHLALS